MLPNAPPGFLLRFLLISSQDDSWLTTTGRFVESGVAHEVHLPDLRDDGEMLTVALPEGDEDGQMTTGAEVPEEGVLTIIPDGKSARSSVSTSDAVSCLSLMTVSDQLSQEAAVDSASERGSI